MFDVTSYLKEKATAEGLVLLGGPAANEDSLVFVITDGRDASAGLSMSGLELMQNPSDEAIKSLADHRFECSLKTFRAFS